MRNHAGAMLACDFFVTITASFRTLYVFVLLEVGTRRIVHWNVTEHPTADWTVQQFRAVVPGDQPQRFLIHDRDSIFPDATRKATQPSNGHRIPNSHSVIAVSILAGLHHEYRLESLAA